MILYISGPYRSKTPYGILQNIRAAESVALKYWRLGYVIICPHKNTALFDGELPDHRWLDGDLEILGRCDGIVMMQNWRESAGAEVEHGYAIEKQLKIIYDEK